jgi:hypothetical protein
MKTEVEIAARDMAVEGVSAMGEWVAEMRPWDCFGGLTYDPKRLRRGERFLRPRHLTGDWNRQGQRRFQWSDDHPAPPLVHREVVERHVKDWVRECAALLGRRIEYVIALERQHFTGQWHAHPLMDCGGADQADRSAMGMAWYRAHGLSKLDYPRSSQDAATYASKYLFKDMEAGDALLSPGLRRSLEGRVQFLEGFSRGRTE